MLMLSEFPHQESRFSLIFSSTVGPLHNICTAIVDYCLCPHSLKQLIHGCPNPLPLYPLASLYSTQVPPKCFLFLSLVYLELKVLFLVVNKRVSLFCAFSCIVSQFHCSGVGAKRQPGMRGGPVRSFHLFALIVLLLLLCENLYISFLSSFVGFASLLNDPLVLVLSLILIFFPRNQRGLFVICGISGNNSFED